MMSILNTWQFNLLGYILCNVLFNQFYKLAVKKVIKDGAVTVILQGLAGLSALCLAPFFPIKFPQDWKLYALLATACVFFAMSDRLQTTIRKNLDVSVYILLNQLSSVFLIVYGLTIFREPLVFTKIVGAGFILAANILLRYSGGKFHFNRYIFLSVLASVIFATGLSIDVGISRNFNLPVYIMLTLIVPSLIIKTAERTTLSDLQAEFQYGSKKYFILTGVSWGLLVFFMIRAFQFGSFSLITPLSATAVLINVLVATLLLGERTEIARKIIAALIIMAGVYLTVYT